MQETIDSFTQFLNNNPKAKAEPILASVNNAFRDIAGFSRILYFI